MLQISLKSKCKQPHRVIMTNRDVKSNTQSGFKTFNKPKKKKKHKRKRTTGFCAPCSNTPHIVYKPFNIIDYS